MSIIANLKVDFGDPALAHAVHQISSSVQKAGGRTLLVGGSVRDALLGLPAKDVDLEVYGIPPHSLVDLLSGLFSVDLVGAAFGVVKVQGLNLDVSTPRRESKSGTGHRGFEVVSEPHISFREAAERRDFTINSIASDLNTGEVLDPYGGIRDLQSRVLRHTSAKFAEDPLRVLRAMQFAARFKLTVAPETVEVCRAIQPEGLPKERIFEEWKKLLLKGKQPSLGLRFLRACGWVKYYPELSALIGCPQDPLWHPEGDVWEHTLHCLDAFARHRLGSEHEDLIVGLAVLCHDFGKPLTTVEKEGRIRSPGHDEAGVSPTMSFLERMTNQRSIMEEVVPLVLEHMRPQDLYDTQASLGAVRRLAARVGRIDRLVRVAQADSQGRPPQIPTHYRAGEWLLHMAQQERIETNKPRPLLMGRHLIALGLSPGPRFTTLLSVAYEAQLEGEFKDSESGLQWLRRAYPELQTPATDSTQL